MINNVIIKIKDVVITTYVIFAITSLILAIINATADLYNVRELNRKIAIELHTHVWTYRIMQEKNNISSKKANAVMYPTYS